MQLLCPKCHNIMAQYERNRVLVDQCTECKGIFLDRGEFENLVEAEKAYYGSPLPTATAPAGDRSAQRPTSPRPNEERRSYGDGCEDRPYRKKKRSSVLEELFDF